MFLLYVCFLPLSVYDIVFLCTTLSPINMYHIHMYMNKNALYTNKRPCTLKPSYQPKTPHCAYNWTGELGYFFFFLSEEIVIKCLKTCPRSHS